MGLGQLIWGQNKQLGGVNTRQLLRALHDLREARFTVPAPISSTAARRRAPGTRA